MDRVPIDIINRKNSLVVICKWELSLWEHMDLGLVMDLWSDLDHDYYDPVVSNILLEGVLSASLNSISIQQILSVLSNLMPEQI